MAVVITGAIMKGGTAKTTTIINLAALAAQDGKRVLVCDLDPQANATYMLTGEQKDSMRFKGKGIFNLFRSYDPESSIDTYIHESNVPGVDIIPSNGQTPMAVGQLDILADEYSEPNYKFLQASLAKVSERYDIIFCDTPPSRDVLTICALFAADHVIIPCRCEEFSIAGLESSVKIIRQLERDEGTVINIIGILLTAVERTAATTYVTEKLDESEFGPLQFNTKIRKGSAVMDSVLVAQPVVIYAKTCNPSKDYEAVYEEMKERIQKWEERNDG